MLGASKGLIAWAGCNMKILVTGGAGFIGSALVRFLIRETTHEVVNLDALTYAGNLDSVASVATDARYHFEHADIRDRARVDQLLAHHQPDAVLHLAAETHVDRSIQGPMAFVETNLLGTATLLEAVRDYWQRLSVSDRAAFRFHHVSSDEVYGDLGDGEVQAFTEQAAYAPSSPYSASKAGADHLVRAWGRTFGLPVLISNCSNNYGPWQYPEKLIPLVIRRALAGESLPVYGDGRQRRDWLYVEDHVQALYRVLTDGRPGQTYNVGGGEVLENLTVVRMLCELLDELAPRAGGHAALIEHVQDRPGHDRCYAIDSTRIRSELAWQPRTGFVAGLRKTVLWYLDQFDRSGGQS